MCIRECLQFDPSFFFSGCDKSEKKRIKQGKGLEMDAGLILYMCPEKVSMNN